MGTASCTKFFLLNKQNVLNSLMIIFGIGYKLSWLKVHVCECFFVNAKQSFLHRLAQVVQDDKRLFQSRDVTAILVGSFDEGTYIL